MAETACERPSEGARRYLREPCRRITFAPTQLNQISQATQLIAKSIPERDGMAFRPGRVTFKKRLNRQRSIASRNKTQAG